MSHQIEFSSTRRNLGCLFMSKNKNYIYFVTVCTWIPEANLKTCSKL